ARTAKCKILAEIHSRQTDQHEQDARAQILRASNLQHPFSSRPHPLRGRFSPSIKPDNPELRARRKSGLTLSKTSFGQPPPTDNLFRPCSSGLPRRMIRSPYIRQPYICCQLQSAAAEGATSSD